jgi:hypothetical protein
MPARQKEADGIDDYSILILFALNQAIPISSLLISVKMIKMKTI